MSFQTIPIFFTFDNNYTVPAAVAFYSLLHRAKAGIAYEMHVLHHDISAENQQLLQDVVHRFEHAKLHFIRTDGFLKDEWQRGNFDGHNERAQFTVDTIIACFGARFFPQYDKIICSDVDVVFADDISELWEIDLTDKYMAGVRSAFLKYSPAELSHLSPEHYQMLKDSYIATGILVMNLELIRRDHLEDKMLEIVRDASVIKRWPDQDILNIACRNRIAPLPLNYIAYPYLLNLLLKPEFESHYSREELWDSILHPKILHYAAQKPWKRPVRYADAWWDIYHYLGLPRTGIFEDYDPAAHIKQKVKRYKRLALFLCAVMATLAAVAIFLLAL